MSWPSKIYVATKTLGVYYTSNFHDPATQPTWAAVNSGLPATDVRQFALDPFEPEARQYLMLEASRVFYMRENGGDWVELFVPADLHGMYAYDNYVTCSYFGLDPSVRGRIWISVGGGDNGWNNWIAAVYSDDYGATWHAGAVAVNTFSISGRGNIVAYGDKVWMCTCSWAGGSTRVMWSTDKAVSWSMSDELGFSAWTTFLHLNSLNPIKVYCGGNGIGGPDLVQVQNGTQTMLQAGLGFMNNTLMWFSPTLASKQRLIKNNKVYQTTDDWASINSPSACSPSIYCPSPWAGADENQMIVALGINTALPPLNYHVIGVLSSYDSTTPAGIAGAHCDASPYTDSIPNTCGGATLGGIQAVRIMPTAGPTPPPDSTITPPGGSPITLGGTANTQAVTMPGYDGNERGEPLPGDRGAWAVDTAAHAALHASDITDSAPVYHNPTGATSGDAPIWDGSKWVPGDVLTPAEHTAIGNDAPHHAPVTLGEGNLDLLALDGQELTLSSPFTENGDLLTSSGAGLVIGDTDIAPTGTADANSYASAEFAPSKANDSNENTRWGCSSGTNVNSWIRITFSSAKTIGAFRLNKYVNEDCSNWKIQAWVDGAWLDIYSGTALGDTGKVNLASPQTSTQFRALFVSGLTHANYMSVWTFGLYEATYVSGDLTIIPIGTVGQVLMAGENIPEWGDLPEPEALPDHDHSGDAGDGGQFDAANLSSGTATDGQVLTADGSGGAAWEDAAAVGGAYAETIGNGTDLDFDIVHNLGTTDVVVQVYDLDLYEPDILAQASVTVIDANTVNVAFESVPAVDQYRVVILAAGGSGGGSGTDEDAIHDNKAGEIHAITEKTSLADNDEFLIEDSADSYNKKRVKKSNLGGGGGAPTDATYVVEDANANLSAESVLGSTVITTAAYASRQAAAKAGRIFLPNNGFYLQRDTGSAWASWGPIFPMTPPPALSNWTWVNQGSATASETYGAIYLNVPPKQGTNLRMLVRSAPSAPYNITAYFLARVMGGDYKAGLCWRDDASGKIISVAVTGESGGQFSIQKWNSPSSWNSNYVNPALNANYVGIWMGLSDDSTNRMVKWSSDGQNWETIHMVSRTDFLTATQVGIFVIGVATVYSPGLTLLSWKEA